MELSSQKPATDPDYGEDESIPHLCIYSF